MYSHGIIKTIFAQPTYSYIYNYLSSLDRCPVDKYHDISSLYAASTYMHVAYIQEVVYVVCNLLYHTSYYFIKSLNSLIIRILLPCVVYQYGYSIYAYIV